MPDDSRLRLIRALGDTLDGLDVALCAFDDSDRTLAWNSTFFKFFPEHAGHVYVGEPYEANLRRFYTQRLDAQELPNIERYITVGVERHRAQTRPYSFEHGGLRVHVSSLPIDGVGRVRVWRAEALTAQRASPDMAGQASGDIHEPGYLRSPVIKSTELFDRIPDGLMICAEDQRIQWVNQPFMQMYHLPDRATAVGLAFDEVYRHAWSVGGEGDMAQFYDGLSTLQEHMRFAGAPFEVPLPRSRWSRVIAKQGSDGTVFYAHVDITELKRQQRLLAQAERSARDSEAQLREKSILLEPVNDRYGHAVGDQLLVWVARQLTQAAREDDVVARLGGDEFALLQRGVSDGDSAYRLADRLVQALGQPTEIEAHTLQIGASIGIVLSPGDGTEAEELLRKADSAMYLAKATGRGCARIYGT